VVDALTQRARVHGSRWRVNPRRGELIGELIEPPVDSIVFCSILHEIYSYTSRGSRWPRSASGPRGVLGARVRRRIVIRDGVQPPPGAAGSGCLAPDGARRSTSTSRSSRPADSTSPSSGRDRVELSTADAMEFLYTYTWGPRSFPYEVRELYRVLPYDDYVAQLVAWFGGQRAVAVSSCPRDRSYLQPANREHLAGRTSR